MKTHRAPLRHLPLPQVHGVANVTGGLWPLLHRRSFEAVFGPKADRWLMYTVAGLLAGNGTVQLLAGDNVEGRRQARNLGVTTAAVLLAIDLTYAPTGRIPRTYLLDAAMELGWLTAWAYDATQ
jgi:hypothetical protein